MISPTVNKPLRPAALALLAAGLLVLSAPGGPLPMAIWAALAPLIVLVRIYNGRTAFLGTFFAVSVWYGFSFHWVATFHPLALAVLFLLEAPLFTLLPLWVARRIGTRKTWVFLFPSLWALGDWINHTWIFRFPFASLAYTQYGFREAIQVCGLGGPYILTWLIAFVNACLAESLIPPERRQTCLGVLPWRNAVFAGVALLAYTAVIGYGSFAFKAVRFPEKPALKVGLAQTLFPPKANWNKNEKAYLSRLLAQESSFTGLGIDLLLLPELVIDRPLSFIEDSTLGGNAEILNSQSDTSSLIGAPLVFGCLERKKSGETAELYNSLAMFGPDKTLRGIYRKRVLVPFGEFDPFDGLFPGFGAFLENSAQAVSLSTGPSGFLFTINGRQDQIYKAAALICYESTSPELARDDARNGADFFIAATSDYWSASPLAALQHSIISIFRAVETGKPVLRIANGGYSGYIDERGAFAGSVPLFREGNMVCNLFVRQNVPETLYVRFGNWIIALSFWFILFSLIFKACPMPTINWKYLRPSRWLVRR